MKYKIDNFGLIGYIIQKDNDGFLVSTKDFLYADVEPFFSKFLETISGEILSKSNKLIKPHEIDNMLVTINENDQATVIINEIDIFVSGFLNNEALIGQSIDINSMPHISYANINELNSNERFILFFNLGWSRGVCFDLTPRDSQYSIQPQSALNIWIGQAISYLAFKNRLHTNTDNWEYYLKNDIFPFNYLNTDLHSILNNLAVENNNNFDEIFFTELSQYFDVDIMILQNKWKNNPYINEEIVFINTAINRYIDADYISCISILHPRIEKLLRLQLSNNSEEPHVRKTYSKNNMANSIQINFDKSIYPHTPLLLEKFSDYLLNSFFKDFEPGKFSEKIGRHTVCHGVASQEFFNKKYAMISLLIIDQLYYYLGADNKLYSIQLN